MEERLLFSRGPQQMIRMVITDRYAMVEAKNGIMLGTWSWPFDSKSAREVWTKNAESWLHRNNFILLEHS